MVFRLGEWEIDAQSRRIGTGDEAIRVSPKAMNVLSVLADAQGGVVSRDHLLETVWPDVTVGEEVLTQAIGELRRALGDRAQQPRIIETVHRSGYRLLVPTESLARKSVNPGSQTSDGSADKFNDQPTTPAGRCASGKPSIAVLPLQALSGHTRERVMAEGISADVTISLARTRWLFVSARASAAALAQQTRDTARIAQRLGVRYVLDGAILIDGNRLKITVNLSDAIEGGEVWGERFDRNLDDLFQVMDDIARQVSIAVETEIEGQERRRALLQPLHSLDAWGLYHRARQLTFSAGMKELDTAIGLLQQALALDPVASRILSGLSVIHARRTMLAFGAARDQELHLARDFAERAVVADARDPQAQMAFGRTITLAGDPTEAGRHLAEAVRLNPSYAHGHFYYGYNQLYAHNYENGLRQTETACQLSPYDPMMFGFFSLRAQLLSLNGDVDQGADWAERALKQPRAHFQNDIIAAWCCARAGQTDKAIVHAQTARQKRPDFSIDDYFEAFRFPEADRAKVEEALLEAKF